ncbi:C-signal-like [Erythrolamprus reginae]|uniref:C-signal-like n=1 Tax=Erythrolamprus reginae TaxID=121349 RepID=UPI00396C412F
MAKSMDLSVFSVLVTGSDRGIGLGLVKRFLDLPSPPKWVFATTMDLEGADNQELKELACQYPNLVVLQLDVTKLESVQAVVKEVQKCVGESGLTLLINNAGLGVGNDLDRENARDMMRVYSVNTIGPLHMGQACHPLLKLAARRSPCQGLSACKAAIVNLSSILGSIELMDRWETMKYVAYRCSKTALNMLTKCQSLEYSSQGILCLAIHPGRVKTSKLEVSADMTVEESTKCILTVLSMISDEDNGTFVDWLGRRIPW